MHPLTSDRVFVKAITTIKALSSRSNYGLLPRPPAENRIKLYGLYKQATEGDVEGIMTRPVGHTMEDEGAKKKWDAWKREEGLSKTQAKRHYISYLIETMKVYASGTLEARELLGELEYLWDQIKDVHYDDYEDDDRQYPVPPHSPTFTQSDRYSTNTPLPPPSHYSGVGSVATQQYRNNLHKIYSHSRRSTMLSINDYINQQRNDADKITQLVQSLPANLNESTIEDFKNWQGEINLIINRLSKEFLSKKQPRRTLHPQSSDSESESDYNPSARLRKRVVHLLKVVGIQGLQFAKNISVSLLAILFIVWCIKKNVIVERTLVKQQVNNKERKELVINMILNTRENKWFIRLLSLINSFVGFV